jgi:hypothetical protein
MRSFTERRLHKSPDYSIEAWITGVSMPGGGVQWSVVIEGEDDADLAAGMLERAAEVLRDDDSKERAFNFDVFT